MKSILLNLFILSVLLSNDQSFLDKSASLVLDVFGNTTTRTDHHWRDLSPALHEISMHGHSLSLDTKEKLISIGFNFSGNIVNRTLNQRSESSGLDEGYDLGIFRFHYTLTGVHGVDETDLNNNSTPDYIDSMAETFVFVYDQLVNEMGYFRPPSDGWLPESYDNGGSYHYDIYIRRLSSSYYGYVQSEYMAQNTGNNEFSSNIIEQNAVTSYMAMRNNYNGFPNSEIENIQVTSAHEFFHAIQYGYDGYEKPWMLEATAVWMEEEIYDDINDCYQYMYNWFNSPELSLDKVGGTHWYGSWIYFQYIDEHLGGPITIKQILDESVNSNSQNNDFSHRAIDDALSPIGSSFEEALKGMSIANIVMSSDPGQSYDDYTYEEADDFPVDGPNVYGTINYSSEEPDSIESTSLNNFASQYIKISAEEPILITLESYGQPNKQLSLHGVVNYSNQEYSVVSSLDSIFIYDSIDESDEIYAIVVSHGEIGSTNFDYVLKVEPANTPPEPFTIEEPSYNSRISITNPNFRWSRSEDNNVMDSVLYVLELGRNMEHLEPIYIGPDTSFTPNNQLTENIIYYWKVYAYDLGENRTYNSNGLHRFLIRNSNPENDILITSVYPNPFPSNSPAINSIRFSIFLEVEENIKVSVTDILGRKVAHIYEGILMSGFYDHMAWNGKNMLGNLAPSGIFYFTIETGRDIKNHKITLIR